MTTIINNPAPTSDKGSESGGGFGILIGVIVLIIFVAVVLFFGIPAIRNREPIKVNVPAPQVVIPDKIDVNVTPTK